MSTQEKKEGVNPSSRNKWFNLMQLEERIVPDASVAVVAATQLSVDSGGTTGADATISTDPTAPADSGGTSGTNSTVSTDPIDLIAPITPITPIDPIDPPPTDPGATGAALPDLTFAAVDEFATFSATIVPSAPASSFELLSAPDGMSIDGSGNIQWTTGELDGGSSHDFTVKVTYTDGLTAQKTYSEFVNEVNSNPFAVASSQSDTISSGVPYHNQIIGTDPDLPEQVLTYQLLNAPPGMTIDANSGLVSWLNPPPPVDGVSQFYLLKFSVTDDHGGYAENVWTIKVIPGNSSPIIDSTPNTAPFNENTLYQYDVNAHDNDLPPQSLVYSLLSAPTGMTIDANTGLIQWTPTEEQGGTSVPFHVQVQVDDGAHGLANQSFELNVNEVNDSPIIDSTPDTSAFNEGTEFQYQVIAHDNDVPLQTLTYSLLDAPVGMAIDANGLISWTPTEAQGGTGLPFHVQVQVDDGANGLASQSFDLNVNEVNSSPVIDSNPNTAAFDEGTEFQYQVLAHDNDLPSQTLTYSLIGAPAGVTIDANGLIKWTPTEAQGGTGLPFHVQVQVNDGANGLASQSFDLNVNEVNALPTIDAINAQTITAGSAFSYNVVAHDSDLPAQVLSYDISGAPNGMTIDHQTGQINWAASVAGDYQVTVHVNDGALGTASTLLALHVNSVMTSEAPEIQLFGGMRTYIENHHAIKVAPGVFVNDNDSPNFNGGSLNISITQGVSSQDQLVILQQDHFSVSGNHLLFKGVSIATLSGGNNGADLVIHFDTDVNAMMAAKIIQHVGFYVDGDRPSTADRLVTFQINDGDGGTSDAVSKMIRVFDRNDNPEISALATSTQAASHQVTDIGLSLGIQFSDPDLNGTDLIEVKLSVDKGLLNISNLANLDIDATFATQISASGVKTISFIASIDDANLIMNHLTYISKVGFHGTDYLQVKVSDMGGDAILGCVGTDKEKFAILVA